MTVIGWAVGVIAVVTLLGIVGAFVLSELLGGVPGPVMRALWVLEHFRDGRWRATALARETRNGARTIARMFRTKGEAVRVVRYVPEACHGPR